MKETTTESLFVIVTKTATPVMASDAVYNDLETAELTADSDIERVITLKELLEEYGAL